MNSHDHPLYCVDGNFCNVDCLNRGSIEWIRSAILRKGARSFSDAAQVVRHSASSKCDIESEVRYVRRSLYL